MKRLLLTGARGFIGRNMLVPALEAGFEVHGVRSSRGGLQREFDLPVTWHVGDLLHKGVAEALIERVKPSHLLHAAWVTDHDTYWTSAANLNWLALGTRMANAFASCGGQRFVSVGSCAEYDWTDAGRLVEGVSREEPATFYGRIKLCHHRMLMAAGQQMGFSAATGRLFFVYGPHEGPKRLIAYACRQLGSGTPAHFSSGRQRRDFLHVEDAARGLIALLDAPILGACNVSSGTAESIRDIVGLIGKIAGREDLIYFDDANDRVSDPPLIIGDATQLRTIGWVPHIPLEQGLSITYNWWQANRSRGVSQDPLSPLSSSAGT